MDTSSLDDTNTLSFHKNRKSNSAWHCKRGWGSPNIHVFIISERVYEITTPLENYALIQDVFAIGPHPNLVLLKFFLHVCLLLISLLIQCNDQFHLPTHTHTRWQSRSQFIEIPGLIIVARVWNIWQIGILCGIPACGTRWFRGRRECVWWFF